MSGILTAAFNRLPPELKPMVEVDAINTQVALGTPGVDTIDTQMALGTTMFDEAVQPYAMDDQRAMLNDGGYVYAANGADLSGMGGGPMGTDTIPAFLTENEFIIDADSAKQFGPVLEKINAWEPDAGSDDYFLNEVDNMINRFGGV